MKTLILIILLTAPCLVEVSEIKINKLTPVESAQLISIKKHIMTLKKMPEAKLNMIAHSIMNSSKTHKVEPTIIISIIMVESSFNQNAVSSTGDISIVQINYKVWGKESKRLKFDLDQARLKKDSNYAIDRMGVILSYLHKTYSTKDPHWYARYHSKTSEHKMAYLKKVNKARTAHIETLPNTGTMLVSQK